MKVANKFSNRIRFNWGYHDAAQSVNKGWNSVGCNFGFGPTLKINTPGDVLARHPDKFYAEGWIRGYRDAEAKIGTSSSEAAWNSFAA